MNVHKMLIERQNLTTEILKGSNKNNKNNI